MENNGIKYEFLAKVLFYSSTGKMGGWWIVCLPKEMAPWDKGKPKMPGRRLGTDENNGEDRRQPVGDRDLVRHETRYLFTSRQGRDQEKGEI